MMCDLPFKLSAGEQEGSFHPETLSKLLRITDIPASLSPLRTRSGEKMLKASARDRPSEHRLQLETRTRTDVDPQKLYICEVKWVNIVNRGFS